VADTDSDGDGTPNCNDGCPNDPDKITPGICGCGVADTDSDGDGTPNCNDGCPNDRDKITPGICGCGVADTDSDSDGTADCHDGCPNDANKITPGVCGCGVSDLDSDADGTPNCADGCPNDPGKIAPGFCGCGVSEIDSDNDGTPDCGDGCPQDPLKLVPGVCGCGRPDVDSDGDGVLDCNETADALEADVLQISLAARGIQHLTLHAGANHAGRLFVMLGSLSGTEPGFDVNGVHVPLVIDPYLRINLLPRYPSAIVPVLGVLDARGEAHVEIQAARLHGRGFWVGRTIHHAFVVLDQNRTVLFASNPVGVTIVR
jgi:hypothetical protein